MNNDNSLRFELNLVDKYTTNPNPELAEILIKEFSFHKINHTKPSLELSQWIIERSQAASKNHNKTALIFGVLLGAINIIYGLMLFSLEMHIQKNTTSNVIGYVIFISLIIWGIVDYRNKNQGSLKLSDALKTGLGISLISSIVLAIYLVIFIKFIDPDFIEETLKISRQTILQEQPEISEENVNQMIKMQKKFVGPFMISSFMIIFNLFFGFIISLIGGLLLKKSPME